MSENMTNTSNTVTAAKRGINKQQVMPAVVLTVICIAVAALLSVLNLVTRDKIAENDMLKEQAALTVVYEGGAPFTEVTDLADLLGESSGATVTKAWYNEQGGYVMRVVTKGYKDGLELMLGISPDGKITGITHVASSETNSAESKLNSFYVGKGNGSSTVVSGSTMTSDGYKNAVSSAFAAKEKLDAHLSGELGKGDNQNG